MENVVNFYSNKFGSCKKRFTFLNRKSKNGCFTTNNNVGIASYETLLDFDDAKYNFNNLNYSLPVYTLHNNEGIFLSYEKKYNPIITNRVYRYEDMYEINYKWIKTDDDGKIIKSVLINKTIKENA